ncbi:cytochrome P450 [Xylaria bambusicola]|uniref:cytochrome P450 n=1 Tax=Xylaria bambusicola TaxID=326684 RepID=UPI00200735A7|nr:cytochrome P450 [Xylaria bambusicola]KAI0521211.1 cytochrome P450 [Xylaria bambusicola]
MSTMQLLALGQLAMGSPITLAFCVVLVVVAVLAALKRTRSSRQIPRVGKAPGWFGLAEAKRDFIANGRLLIDEGYRKYKNSMFLVQTADMERIVLSPQYVDELRAAPESVLSLREGMSQRHLGQFTTLDVILTSHLQNDVCKTQLTQNLSDFVPTMNEEASFWLAEQISSTSTHAELTGYEAMLKIVTGMSSRIFVGQSLSKDERWLRMIVEYTIDVFLISTALRPYPAMIRPLIAPWLSSVKRMQRHLSIAQELFAPVFASSMSKESKSSRDYSVLEWMARSAQGGDRDPRILVKKLLFLTLAAIHTSTMSITHALFDLCEHTECIEPLREEIKAAVRTHGWTLPAVNSMKLLDSFLKESQRINHPGLLSFNRWVRSPLHLSDGTVLPANTFISMPTNSIAHDPELYKNPECFDVFRFLNKRLASQADAQRHQFVSTSSDSLPFGHGKFACPGRFFAAAQIKIVLANIIMKYDVSFPDSQTRRPDNVFTGEGIAPDRKQKVVFKQRGKR